MFYILCVEHNKKLFSFWLKDQLWISGGELFESVLFSLWSVYIRRGDNVV